MNKIIKLIGVFGIILLIVSGCGKSAATEGKKNISDELFSKGSKYKISDSNENTPYFEVTSQEKNMLTIYDLENNRKDYQVSYSKEKQKNGYILYKFDGPVINDYRLFYNGIYGKTQDYYMVFIDDKYYFVTEEFLNKQGGDLNNKKTKEYIKNYGLTALEKVD